MSDERIYIAIDLKSFYASVECVDRGLDPLAVNLVVADESRTEKTICLAVSPALKSLGIPGRARLFEVIEKVREANASRLTKAPGNRFTGKSDRAAELLSNPALSIDYIVAPPRMRRYMQVSSQIYGIYLRYIAPEDIHVYSVDEVFIDATAYLKTYGMTPRELTMKLVREVLSETGITATAGIGTNMYLAKIAMDVKAKKMKADKDGVRIAELTERSYREEFWDHRPLKDFWQIGRGIAGRLERLGILTMGDIARCSLTNEDLLYKIFGVKAGLIIDHAWGWEPCKIADIKSYVPENNSLSSGQVLSMPYAFDKAKLVMREMTELLVMDLVEKHVTTDQMVLSVGYDIENTEKLALMQKYGAGVEGDRYGRVVPKAAHGSVNLPGSISSTRVIVDAVMGLFDRIVYPEFTVRRMVVAANHVIPEKSAEKEPVPEQMDLFTDYAALEEQEEKAKEKAEREKNMQKAILEIRTRFGKNAILKGTNLCEGATQVERNNTVGGHKA